MQRLFLIAVANTSAGSASREGVLLVNAESMVAARNRALAYLEEEPEAVDGEVADAAPGTQFYVEWERCKEITRTLALPGVIAEALW
jgi:hypothetical protein